MIVFLHESPFCFTCRAFISKSSYTCLMSCEVMYVLVYVCVCVCVWVVHMCVCVSYNVLKSVSNEMESQNQILFIKIHPTNSSTHNTTIKHQYVQFTQKTASCKEQNRKKLRQNKNKDERKNSYIYPVVYLLIFFVRRS